MYNAVGVRYGVQYKDHRPRPGPEIEGTRITVYDVFDYHRHGDHHSLIAATLRVSSEQVRSAARYIEEHRAEVETAYQRMLDAACAGNPPHVVALLEKSRAKRLARGGIAGRSEACGEGPKAGENGAGIGGAADAPVAR